MLRKTVAIAGLIGIVAVLLLVALSHRSSTQAAVFASGSLPANTDLPIVSGDEAPGPPRRVFSSMTAIDSLPDPHDGCAFLASTGMRQDFSHRTLSNWSDLPRVHWVIFGENSR